MLPPRGTALPALGEMSEKHGPDERSGSGYVSVETTVTEDGERGGPTSSVAAVADAKASSRPEDGAVAAGGSPMRGRVDDDSAGAQRQHGVHKPLPRVKSKRTQGPAVARSSLTTDPTIGKGVKAEMGKMFDIGVERVRSGSVPLCVWVVGVTSETQSMAVGE